MENINIIEEENTYCPIYSIRMANYLVRCGFDIVKIDDNKNNTKYKSDIVGNQYKNWHNEFVVFDAPTCSGKTYFTLNILSKYAKEINEKVLYLCNRKQLRIEIVAIWSLRSHLAKSSNLKISKYLIFGKVLG